MREGGRRLGAATPMRHAGASFGPSCSDAQRFARTRALVRAITPRIPGPFAKLRCLPVCMHVCMYAQPLRTSTGGIRALGRSAPPASCHGAAAAARSGNRRRGGRRGAVEATPCAPREGIRRPTTQNGGEGTSFNAIRDGRH
eukprot:365125-Chlamydomonas_euryale.AAC.3